MIPFLPGSTNTEKMEACFCLLFLIMLPAILAGIFGLVYDLITGSCGAICKLF